MGSSSCKAVAFSEGGTTLAHAPYSYAPTTPRPLWAEMEAEKFWQAFQTITRAITTEVTKDPVEVLAISSHGETFIPVDSQQHSVAPAILNVDNRAVAEANWLGEDRKSTRLNSSHANISYAVFCLKKKKKH